MNEQVGDVMWDGPHGGGECRVEINPRTVDATKEFDELRLDVVQQTLVDSLLLSAPPGGDGTQNKIGFH